ncbi:MAG: hypothetical protein LC120_08520, partial [Bacteroidales bacterium]|nr:hypothetical protein [Bacteroidales bacterium]
MKYPMRMACAEEVGCCIYSAVERSFGYKVLSCLGCMFALLTRFRQYSRMVFIEYAGVPVMSCIGYPFILLKNRRFFIYRQEDSDFIF